MYYLAQIMGALAIILWVVSIIQRKKSDMLLVQTGANLIFGLQYTFLNVISAAGVNYVSFLRSFMFYNFEKQGKQPPQRILLFFIILTICLGGVTYTNIFHLIPIFIGLAYAYALWQNNLLVTRVIYVMCAVVWIHYNTIVGAHMGIIGNVLEITIGLFSIFKYHFKLN